MSFLRGIGNAIRQGKQFKSTQEAYRLVVRYFHLNVTQESIRETNSYLHQMADTSSVQELAVEYLNLYGRRLVRDLKSFPEDQAEAAAQFRRFAQKIAQMRGSGVEIRERLLSEFCGVAGQLGADTSDLIFSSASSDSRTNSSSNAPAAEGISCPICGQQVRVPSGKRLQIKCPRCEHVWLQQT
jgi:ribosomal protein S27E